MITITCQQCGETIPNYTHYCHICPPSPEIIKQVYRDYIDRERDKELFALKKEVKSIHIMLKKLALLKMNDLTKSELEDLYKCLDYAITYIPCFERMESLRDKIKSMLDKINCIHESDGFIYTNHDFTNGKPYRCNKCGEYYE